jgi:hypothetical protein
MCDDDPWGKNLFENMEFDQVIRIEITQQQTRKPFLFCSMSSPVLMKNILNFLQVLDINSSSTKPDNDHSKKTDNDSVKSSSSKAANEIAEEDMQTEDQETNLCEEDIETFLENESF